jgi:hypothetical protein
MKFLKNLSCAFTSGVIGALVLVLIATLVRGMPSDYNDFKIQLYRLLIWGGVWAILLIFPFYKKKWFLRGSIIGLLVILFNFIVLMPLSGKGFFAVNAGVSVFLGNIIFNYIWGIVAAIWYRITAE